MFRYFLNKQEDFLAIIVYVILVDWRIPDFVYLLLQDASNKVQLRSAKSLLKKRGRAVIRFNRDAIFTCDCENYTFTHNKQVTICNLGLEQFYLLNSRGESSSLGLEIDTYS